MTTARKFNRFDDSGCFTCRSCGKRTRNTGDNGGVQLCPGCLERAGWENTHSDEGHSKESPNSNCPICRENGWVKVTKVQKAMAKAHKARLALEAQPHYTNPVPPVDEKAEAKRAAKRARAKARRARKAAAVVAVTHALDQILTSAPVTEPEPAPLPTTAQERKLTKAEKTRQEHWGDFDVTCYLCGTHIRYTADVPTKATCPKCRSHSFSFDRVL